MGTKLKQSKSSAFTVVALLVLIGIGAGIWYFLSNSPRADSTATTRDEETNSSPSNATENSDQEQSTVLVKREDLPFKVQKNGFVSSAACRECHAKEFESWHGTFHRTMTQVASAESVLAPFENIRLASRGREFYLSREGDRFYVTGPDPDFEASAQASGVDVSRLNPPIVKRQIVMTTGSHHMQGYWVASNTHKNMLRQMPWTYIIAEKRWVPREDNFLVPPDEPRHFSVWNDNCIVCHAVGGNPNFDLKAMTVGTEVAELGISCEACHGPGQPHIAYQRKLKVDKSLESREKDPVVNPAACESEISTEICGQCHAYFSPTDWGEFAKHGYQYRAAGDFAGTRDMTTFEGTVAASPDGRSSLYWNDGTCRVGGREYNAMIISACFQKGTMSCISCHSMHQSDPNDQLAEKMETNEACLQCHKNYRENIEAHTHHPAASSGSLCYNCHMPHTTYGALKTMRSHRVQSPKVASMDKSDHPNACNLCHLDQTLSWSAEKISNWYGKPMPELRAEEKEVAASLLWLLRGDAAQRAITAWHMNWEPALKTSGEQWLTPFLAKTLVDDYAAVRYLAEKALRKDAEFKQLRYDYIGKATDRQAASDKLLEIWSNREKTAIANASQLLFDSQSLKLNQERVADILKRQDKRPTSLPE